MMNKAAGELGPTWELMRDGADVRVRRRTVTRNGYPLTVNWEGKTYTAVQSYVPLIWILKHPLTEWELGLYPDGQSFGVNVPDSPPGWGL